VRPVGPQVDAVDAREVPGGPVLVLGLPGLGEPVDRRGRQTSGRAEELCQGGGEVAGRRSPQLLDTHTAVFIGGATCAQIDVMESDCPLECLADLPEASAVPTPVSRE